MKEFTERSKSKVKIDYETLEELLKIEKGSSESGNYGHAGRPGEVGGSASSEGDGQSMFTPKVKENGTFDISNYASDIKEISDSALMAQAHYDDIKANMVVNLNQTRQSEPKLTDVSGKISSDNTNTISKNGKEVLNAHSDYLSSSSYGMARDFIDNFRETINSDFEAFKNIDANDLNSLLKDSVEKLICQEIESNRQQFTDHGIRHIVGNIERQQDIYSRIVEKPSAIDKLQGMFAMINHDVGYTTPIVREGGARGAIASGKHKEFSEKILMQQKELWNVGKIFTESQYDKMLNIVRNHDSSKIDFNEPLHTSVSLSDNLALFAKDKLPSMFKYVSGGKSLLVKMGVAAKDKNNEEFSKLQSKLYSAVDSTKFSSSMKRDLKSAVKEINYLTPKFTMGTLAGEIESISGKGKIDIDIKYNEWDSSLQKLFDMGQKQTAKLLGDYGIKDFSKTEYSLANGLVNIRVKGYK